jgi:hypothetical protein
MCPGLCLSHAGTPCSGNAPDPDHWKGLFMHSAQCVAPGEVIIPWNEPEVRPVAAFIKRTVVKLPVAPANRPVPPVTAFISVMERTPGVPDGSLDPTIVVKMLSPLAAIN